MTTSFGQKFNKTAITEKIRKFYDIGSPLYLNVYGEHIHDGYYITGRESKQKAQENLIQLLVEKARLGRDLNILDVGCGVGGSSMWMAKNLGARTVGITISPVQVEIARKLAQQRKVNSTFLVMDAENISFDNQFDVIWVSGAISHFKNQPGFIKLASQYLNTGGKFIIFDWMLDDHVLNMTEDRHVNPVAERMLLSSLYPLNSYLNWFIEDDYKIIYSEDITDHTIKTWDDALSVIKQPAVLKLASRINKREIGEVLNFFKSIGEMKIAMQKGKIKSGVVIAQKL